MDHFAVDEIAKQGIYREPDGVPIIGRPQHVDNLVIAAGHQMLGLQTAPATDV